jgi:prepilin-type N-terminal cleavage/methylation domain-containing protein
VLAGERGFTLAELLVVIVILGMIMAALFGVLDVSQKVYTRASSSEDAQITARAALDLMAREIALAGSFYSSMGGSDVTFWGATTGAPPTASLLTLRGELDSDAVTTASAASGTSITVTSATNFCASEWLHIADGSAQEVRQIASVTGNTITLALPLLRTYGAGSVVRSVETVSYVYDAGTRTLVRTMTHDSSCAVPAVAERILVENVLAFAFTYFDDTGGPTTSAVAIREIQISITTAGSAGHRRTMQVRVRPTSLTLT